MTIKSKFTDSKSNKLDWDRLKVFYALVHSGTLEKTHELTGIPVSSISYHIKELENALGIKLINRNKGGQGDILTDAGQVFVKATADMYKRIEDAISEVENKEEISGKITIATSKGFGISWLIPNLIAFKKTYPDIVYDVIFVDVFPNLVNYTADLYISPKFGAASNLIHEHLGHFEFRAYASKDYLEQYGTPETAEDLNNHKILGWRQRAFFPETDWLLTAGMQKGLDREPHLILDDVSAMLLVVESGLGIALFVEYIELVSNKLIRILENYNLGNVELYLITNPEAVKSKKVSLISTYLKTLKNRKG